MWGAQNIGYELRGNNKVADRLRPKPLDGAIPYLQVPERNGGDDGTRTRGLCRDSERLTSSFNNLESTDGTVSHWKYALGEVIVCRGV